MGGGQAMTAPVDHRRRLAICLALAERGEPEERSTWLRLAIIEGGEVALREAARAHAKKVKEGPCYPIPGKEDDA